MEGCMRNLSKEEIQSKFGNEEDLKLCNENGCKNLYYDCGFLTCKLLENMINKGD